LDELLDQFESRSGNLEERLVTHRGANGFVSFGEGVIFQQEFHRMTATDSSGKATLLLDATPRNQLPENLELVLEKLRRSNPKLANRFLTELNQLNHRVDQALELERGGDYNVHSPMMKTAKTPTFGSAVSVHGLGFFHKPGLQIDSPDSVNFASNVTIFIFRSLMTITESPSARVFPCASRMM
jgi:hypothetical protein